MGYPDEHPELTEAVEYEAPYDVVFAAGFDDVDLDSIATVTVGAGGGPHHRGSLSTVRSLTERGGDVQVVSVTPGDGGTPEDPADTVAALDGVDVDVTEITAATVADGLVKAAKTDGGILVVGASRDRRLSQWVLGSTPDRVVDRAEEGGVPMLVYASASGVPGRIEDYLFPVYRYLSRRLRNVGIRPFRRFNSSHVD